MNIIVIGINHEKASLDVREKIAFTKDKVVDALQNLSGIENISESLILSTCNRVELYLVGKHSEKLSADIFDFLSVYHNIPTALFKPYLYEFVDNLAVNHLFRVAGSLDSMVIGEPQILGQVKDAYTDSVNASTTGPILNKLFHRAFFIGKKIRTETNIGEEPVSISSCAVSLSQKIFEDLKSKKALLLGAGEMGVLTAKYLKNSKLDELIILNRTHETAIKLARELRAKAKKFSELEHCLEISDIVIAQTGAKEFVLTKEEVEKALSKRKGKPIFFIDISVPRNLDPSINELSNCYLYDLDDLDKIIAKNRDLRSKEIFKAEEIVKEDVIKFFKWKESLNLAPTIKDLISKVEGIKDKELEKILETLKEEKDRENVSQAVSLIVKKLLHTPIETLKKESETKTGYTYVDALRTLFKLDEN